MSSLKRVVLLSLTAVVGSALADVVNINASERGWVCPPANQLCTSANNGANPSNNYFAGAESSTDGSVLAEVRNWFEFAIPSLTGGPLTSATLSLDDFVHEGGNLTYAVYGLNGRPLIFSDVTTSSPYGSVSTTDTSSGTTITITLNAAALAAIGADQGGNIFIGGIDSAENLSPCAITVDCAVGDFGSTQRINGTFNTVLTLTTTQAAVPEPFSAALLATMILLLAGVAMRRRKALSH
jgi:hypothetical protein